MDKRALTGRIIILALLIRLLVFAAAARGVFLVGEGRTQANLATNILNGNGFMLSGEMLYPEEEQGAPLMFRRTFEFYRRVDGYYGALRPDSPTVFLVPGYAVFMAGVFAVFGIGNYLAVRGVQLLLGLLTVLAGMSIARRFFKSWKWLAAAGLFFALDPFELYYEAVPATQALFSLLFLTGILLTLKLMERTRNRGRWLTQSLLAGGAWAGAFYVRPASLPIMVWGLLLLPFLPLLDRMLKGRGGFGKGETLRIFSLPGFLASATVFVLFMLLMLPWGLRNLDVTGSFRIMPAQGGVNIWEYNGRIFTDHFQGEARGALILYRDIREEYLGRLNSPELAEFPEFRDEPEWERDRILYRRNISFMMSNPVLTLRLITLRFVEFFKPFPLNSFSPLYTMAGILGFFWVLLFLWGGAVLAAVRYGAKGFYLATITAGYSLMHLLTASGTPHRVGIDFPMAVLALIGVKHAAERFRAGRGSASNG